MALFGKDLTEGNMPFPEGDNTNSTQLFAENLSVSEGSLLGDDLHPIFNPDHELHQEVFGKGKDIVPFNPAEMDPDFINFLLQGGLQKTMEYLADVHTIGIDAANAKLGFQAAMFLRAKLQGAGIDVAAPLGALRILRRIGAVRKLRLPGMGRRNHTGGGGGGKDGGGDGAGRVEGEEILTADSYDSGRLSIELPPTEIRIETGIVPTTYSPAYQFGEFGYHAPVHATGVAFTLPSSNSPADDMNKLFFYDSVLFDIKNTIQRNITFSPDADLVADDTLRNAFQALASALSMYYSVSRYLVYGSNPMNRNECLLKVRDNITSSVGDKFMRLQRTLQGTPIPPKLNGLMYWLHQFYTTSEAPGSPVIMINPNTTMSAGVPTFSEIDTAINSLVSFNEVYALIGRAIPSWYATNLLTGNGNVVHDPSFSTMWVNLPVKQSGSTHSLNYPVVTNYDSNIYYQSFGDVLDGGVYGLTSMYHNSEAKFIGLMQPITSTFSTNVTNRYSWQTYSNGFVDVYGWDYLQIGRDETYTTGTRYVNDKITAVSFGAERCDGVSYRTVSECTRQLFDWLMSWDTVDSTVGPAKRRKKK